MGIRAAVASLESFKFLLESGQVQGNASAYLMRMLRNRADGWRVRSRPSRRLEHPPDRRRGIHAPDRGASSYRCFLVACRCVTRIWRSWVRCTGDGVDIVHGVDATCPLGVAQLALLPLTVTLMMPMLHVAEMNPLRAAAAECTRGRQESIRQHPLAASTMMAASTKMAASTLIRTPGLRHLGNTQHTSTHTIPLVCPRRLAMSQGGVRIVEGGGKGVCIKDATTTGGNEAMMVKVAVAHTALHTFLQTMVIIRLSTRRTPLIAHLAGVGEEGSGEILRTYGEV